MENSIINRSNASYRLAAAKIQTSEDKKTKYVVAEFVRADLDEMLAEQESSIRLQIMSRFGAEDAARDAYLQKWVDLVGNYECNIGTYEVGGFADFVRKDSEGNIMRKNSVDKDGNPKKKVSVFNSVIIYWFCDEESTPVKGDSYILRRAKNLRDNSKRMMTLEEYKAGRGASDAAKKAAADAAKLLAEADANDDDLG